MELFNKYRLAIVFLLKYTILYLSLNTLYAYYVMYFHPNPDPLTEFVASNVVGVLNAFDSSVGLQTLPNNANVQILKGDRVIVQVYEGCNSFNVIVVFISFLIAFKGPSKLFLKYFFIGIVIIYAINLVRILALYFVSIELPDALYFFHKFFFSGVIYLVVFSFWYFWIKHINKWKGYPAATRG
jgi:exosortase family protein XrtF